MPHKSCGYLVSTSDIKWQSLLARPWIYESRDLSPSINSSSWQSGTAVHLPAQAAHLLWLFSGLPCGVSCSSTTGGLCLRPEWLLLWDRLTTGKPGLTIRWKTGWIAPRVQQTWHQGLGLGWGSRSRGSCSLWIINTQRSVVLLVFISLFIKLSSQRIKRYRKLYTIAVNYGYQWGTKVYKYFTVHAAKPPLITSG